MGNSFLTECQKSDTYMQDQNKMPNIQQLTTHKRPIYQNNFQNELKEMNKVQFYPQRSVQMDKIYKKLIHQKPVLYSIQNRENLEYHGVNNLKQIYQVYQNSNHSYPKKQKLNNFLEQNSSKKSTIPDLYKLQQLAMSPKSSQTNEQYFQQKIKFIKYFLKIQNQKDNSFNNEIGKNIFRSRSSSQSFSDIQINQNQNIQENQTSFFDFQKLQIFNKSFIYIGFLNQSGKPHGSGQLFNFQEIQNQRTLIIFIEAQFNQGFISTEDAIMILKQGNYYRGGFKQNSFHGKGILNFSKGLKLTGHFMYGLLEGKGKSTYPDGGSYEGNFKSGLRQGKGKMIWKSQKRNQDEIGLQILYEGYFQNDKMNGLGYLKTPNYQYWGPFCNNMKQGKGTIKFKDGNKFQGWFQKDEINGYGQLHYANGQIQKGNFPILRQ